jgi:EmrB/QacA subfamily drug resistance transporter
MDGAMNREDSGLSRIVANKVRWPHLGFAALLGILFLTFLDNTVLSASLSSIFLGLHATIPELQWVVGSYAMAFAALMLTGGSLGDNFGRKKVMLVGVALFCAGSLVSALATSTTVLVIGRIIMGIGAAGSEPATLSMIRHLFPDRDKRSRAMSMWVAVSGLALAMGPVVGSLLVGIWTWRAIFWFNLIFGGALLFLASSSLSETRNQNRAPLDYPGMLLGSAVIGMATYATISGESLGYGAGSVITLFVLSAVGFVVFLFIETRTKNPMLNVSFFKIRDFSTSIYIAFASNFTIFAIFFFVALYLEVLAAAKPYTMALDFLPLLVGMMLSSISTGKWIARVGPRLPLTIGTGLAAVGIGVTNLFITPTAGIWTIGLSMGLTGVGIGMLLVPVISTALSTVPKEHSGIAASTINTSRQLGALFAIAILGSIVDAQANEASIGYIRALSNGLSYALNISLALMLVSFLAALSNRNRPVSLQLS